MPLKSNGDGTYVASWVPSESGNYLIQIFIDSCSTGIFCVGYDHIHGSPPDVPIPSKIHPI